MNHSHSPFLLYVRSVDCNMRILWLLAVFAVVAKSGPPTEDEFKASVEAIWSSEAKGTPPDVVDTISKLNNQYKRPRAKVDEYFKLLDAFNNGYYGQGTNKSVVLWTGSPQSTRGAVMVQQFMWKARGHELFMFNRPEMYYAGSFVHSDISTIALAK